MNVAPYDLYDGSFVLGTETIGEATKPTTTATSQRSYNFCLFCFVCLFLSGYHGGHIIFVNSFPCFTCMMIFTNKLNSSDSSYSVIRRYEKCLTLTSYLHSAGWGCIRLTLIYIPESRTPKLRFLPPPKQFLPNLREPNPPPHRLWPPAAWSEPAADFLHFLFLLFLSFLLFRLGSVHLQWKRETVDWNIRWARQVLDWFELIVWPAYLWPRILLALLFREKWQFERERGKQKSGVYKCSAFLCESSKERGEEIQVEMEDFHNVGFRLGGNLKLLKKVTYIFLIWAKWGVPTAIYVVVKKLSKLLISLINNLTTIYFISAFSFL